MKTRQEYIDEILDLQDDVRKLADKYYDYFSINEYECVVSDINDYQDEDFETFESDEELKDYIKYLKDLIKEWYSMQNELLYELEYKVGELRRRIIRDIDTDKLTLKQVLDFGLDKVFLNGYELYIDAVNKDNIGYIIDGYYLTDEELLNAVVQYENDEIYVDLYDREYDYLQVKVKFVDDKYNKMLTEYFTKLDMENKQDDETTQEQHN